MLYGELNFSQNVKVFAAQTYIFRIHGMCMPDLPYYGTYHHTNPEESQIIRNALRESFNEMFREIKNPSSIHLALDAGCGLGYLSELTLKFFTDASLIGVDLFGSKSLPEGNMDLARENMKFTGVSSRAEFVKSDLTKLNFPQNHFDLVVSNLVFHNMGKKRFIAYSDIVGMIKPGGYFALGDFFSGSEDIKFLADQMTLLKDKGNIEPMPDRYSIILLRK